jgi:hypothetical protein
MSEKDNGSSEDFHGIMKQTKKHMKGLGPDLRTIEGFIEFQKANAEERIKICEQKNGDYADAVSDENQEDLFKVFANFRAVEKLGICPAETGLLVRLIDKFMRTINLVKKAQQGREASVVDESLRDTILDAQNYLDLLLGYLTLCDKLVDYKEADRMENILHRMEDAEVQEDRSVRVGNVKVSKTVKDDGTEGREISVDEDDE